MRNLLALFFLSFSLGSHSQSLVDSIQVTLTSYCGSLNAVVTGWYNGSDAAFLGHAMWGGYIPYGDQGYEIQPGQFEVDLFVDNWVGWFPLEGTGYCGSWTVACYDELGLVLTSGPDWWWYCPEESPSEVLWNFDYSPMMLGTQLGLDENGNPIDLTTTETEPPCGPGTVWDSSLELCVTDNSFPFAPCGAGTVWDPVNEKCIIAVPTDTDFDGCVTAGDVLNLLATFGTCPPIPEWPDEPTDTTWTCGDPLTYWDHDYATVLIGDQCWFAENLRTTSYTDGTEIPEVTDNEDWTDLTTGAHCSYANDSGNVAVYGLLYNWFAVQDMHGLCPSGWHVPTDGEWTGLETHIGSQGFIGNEGTALKSTSGWSNNGNGTDQFGFTGLPGGDRWYLNGSYFSAGTSGAWWSSSSATPSAWRRRLFDIQSNVDRAVSDDLRNGFSVRCVKD